MLEATGQMPESPESESRANLRTPPDLPKPLPNGAASNDDTASSRKEVNARIIEQVTNHLKARPRFLIDPRDSKILGYWDLTTSIALIYTALITPAEIALLDAAKSWTEPLFLINRLLDLIFIVDIVVQFRLMAEKTRSPSFGAMWLTKPGDIARAYLRSWFALDFTSVLVSGFDYLGLEYEGDELSSGGGSDDQAWLSNLKALRVLRVMRLAKLARLIKMSRVIKRWETRLTINYALLSLTTALAAVLLMAHWISCIWVLQARVQSDLLNTWLGRLEYCTPRSSSTKIPLPLADGNGAGIMDVADVEWHCPPIDCYLAGLYYAFATLTSIGYGDITPTHRNLAEVTVSVCIMFFSCTSWAYLIGVFSAVASSFNPERNHFRNQMDALNRFIRRENFPDGLARRMREYFHQSAHLRAAKSQQTLMSEMPPSLQGEVSWSTNSTWLLAIPFLHGAEPQFMLELSLQLHAVVFSPSDYAPLGYLFIVQRGLMVLRGKVLVKGKVWGEDMVLQNEALRSTAQARALNFVSTNYISRTELLMLSSRYPAATRLIRKYTIWLAFTRLVIHLSKVTKKKREGVGADAFFTTITDAMQFNRDLYAEARMSLGDMPPTPEEGSAADVTKGGQLAGYSADAAVQFDIINARIAELRSELLQSQENMAEATARQSEMLANLCSKLGAPLPPSPPASDPSMRRASATFIKKTEPLRAAARRASVFGFPSLWA